MASVFIGDSCLSVCGLVLAALFPTARRQNEDSPLIGSDPSTGSGTLGFGQVLYSKGGADGMVKTIPH
jgi:hypothetical protein